jgi:hypothetical protein
VDSNGVVELVDQVAVLLIQYVRPPVPERDIRYVRAVVPAQFELDNITAVEIRPVTGHGEGDFLTGFCLHYPPPHGRDETSHDSVQDWLPVLESARRHACG